MSYAIDDNLLTRLKAIAAADPNNADLVALLAAAEADPLVSSLMWTKADLLCAARRLAQGRNPKNPDGTWFENFRPFADAAREHLSQEIVGNPDEFCVGIREEVDSAIEWQVLENARALILDSLEGDDADADVHEMISADHTLRLLISRLPASAVAGGLAGCVREILSEPVR